MTPQERAEKIVREFRDGPREPYNNLVSLIAAQIEEAVNEARALWFLDPTWPDMRYQEGYNTAKEQAAKLIEDHYWDSLVGTKHGESLAKMLRAMKPEEK
jgi:hypothetical protein